MYKTSDRENVVAATIEEVETIVVEGEVEVVETAGAVDVVEIEPSIGEVEEVSIEGIFESQDHHLQPVAVHSIELHA